MANRFGKVYSSMWSDPDFKALSQTGKLLWAYLLTGPHGNMSGYYQVPMEYMIFDLGEKEDRIQAAFSELEERGMAYYSDGTILVTKFLKYNTPTSKTQLQGVGNAVRWLPLSSMDIPFIKSVYMYCPNAFAYLDKPRLIRLKEFGDKNDLILNSIVRLYIIPLLAEEE